jgi:integrase
MASELWRGSVKVVKARITKRSVDVAPVPPIGEARLWDTDLKGFLLRVYPSGRKVYAVKCRVGRVQRVYTIGEHGSPWAPDGARRAALEVLQKARNGKDPSADKKAAKAELSVGQLIDRYLADGPATKPAKRASTWVIDASNLNRHLRPLLGTKIAGAVSKAEAARAILDIKDGKTKADIRARPRGRARVTGGPGASRRTRNVAAAMFAWGMAHCLCSSNPFVGITLASAPVRERFLTKEEARGLLDAIGKLELAGLASNTFADALRLLFLTGARKTEVLGLKWSEVDLVRGILNLPPDRTKSGGKTGMRRIPLSPPAIEILKGRQERLRSQAVEFQAETHPSPQNEFVFPAARGEGHAVGLRRVFQRVCAEANLPGLRIHDLRHSFASFAVANGVSLFLVGKLLGHASARTTERYAHLSGDPLQDAVTSIGREFMGPDH